MSISAVKQKVLSGQGGSKRELAQQVRIARSLSVERKDIQKAFIRDWVPEIIYIFNCFNLKNDKCALLELKHRSGDGWTDV